MEAAVRAHEMEYDSRLRRRGNRYAGCPVMGEKLKATYLRRVITERQRGSVSYIPSPAECGPRHPAHADATYFIRLTRPRPRFTLQQGGTGVGSLAVPVSRLQMNISITYYTTTPPNWFEDRPTFAWYLTVCSTAQPLNDTGDRQRPVAAGTIRI